MFSYHDKGKMYCVYDLDTRPAEPKVTLEIYQAGDGLVERRVFSWAEVLGQTKIKLLSPLPTTKTTSIQPKSTVP